MKIRIDSMTFRDHPAVRSGVFSVIPSARLYEYPYAPEGIWGRPDGPEIQAQRVYAWWSSHPNDGRWVYLKGFGQPMLDCGAVYGADIKYGPSAEEVVSDFERGEVYIGRKAGTGRSDLEWVERFLAELPTLPEMIHVDAEWYYSFWEMNANPERKKIIPLLARSKRARARLPDVVNMALDTGNWTREAIIAFNKHGAELTGQAIRRLFAAAGYTGHIAAFGYWTGSDALQDINGWPISVRTPDGLTGCYGAYDDNEPGAQGHAAEGREDRLPAHAVTAFSVGLTTRASQDSEHQIPVWRAFDPPADLAARIESAEVTGVYDSIIWASPDPADAPITELHLTTLADLLRS